MTQHEDFLRGFGEALGLEDLEQIEARYRAWATLLELNAVELIDLECGGYLAGQEIGAGVLWGESEDEE